MIRYTYFFFAIIIFQEIRRTGIRPFKDPRLKLVIEKLREFKHKPNASLESLNLEYEQFCQVLAGNLPLLVKIFRNDLVIPEFQTFCDSVTTLYTNLKDNFNGEVSFSKVGHLKYLFVISFCFFIPSLLDTFPNWPEFQKTNGAFQFVLWMDKDFQLEMFMINSQFNLQVNQLHIP